MSTNVIDADGPLRARWARRQPRGLVVSAPARAGERSSLRREGLAHGGAR